MTRPSSIKAALFLMVVGLFKLVFSDPIAVKVGLFEDKPKIFTDDKGIPHGIFVDILGNIAQQEGWSIEYVKGTLSECVENLKNGRIDLLPDVLYSKDQDGKFFLNRIPILSDWLVVYKGGDAKIEHLDDLDKKRVAVVDGSVDAEVFSLKELQFGIAPQMVSASDPATCMSMVQNGNADAAVVSRFYEHAGKCPDRVVPTSIILHPAGDYFAVSNYGNKKFLDAIDVHIASMKNDFNSAYYKSLRTWVNDSPVQSFREVALMEAFALLLAFFVMAFLIGKVHLYKTELRHKSVLLRESGISEKRNLQRIT